MSRSKKKLEQPDGQNVAPSTEGASSTIVITNNQRRIWLVPKNLMGSSLFTSSNIVHPGCSVEVSKEEFDKYSTYVEGVGTARKGSKAFASMLDNKLLIASSKKAKIDMRDLKDDAPCKSTNFPHLANDGKVKNVMMSRTPVTLTLEKAKASA